jgi:cation diffusion facilitator CzcD-associated flavoprotein CzcO
VNNRKYCIIGGGATGIGLGKCFGEAGIDYELLEAEDDFGGNWYFGKGAANVYQSTHLISSKTNTQFSDFPMPQDYPDYPNHGQFLAYLRTLARHFKVYDHARFGARVVSAEPKGTEWTVRLESGEERVYSGVIVANGRLRVPSQPRYPGEFTGETMHSKEYISNERIKGKRVLVVGAGNSGCDIAVASVWGASQVLFSMRRGYHFMPKFIAGKATQDWLMSIGPQFKSSEEMWTEVKRIFKLAGYDPTDFGLPKPEHDIDQAHPIMNSQILYHIGHGDILPRRDIRSLQGRRVEFTDGRIDEVDAIIYATGYEMSFPFLSERVLRWKGGRPDLYMYLVHPEYDNLVFFGYINSPSGLGNLVNTGGRFLAEYFKAYERNSKAFQVFRGMKSRPEPDLGQGRFMKTQRHSTEVDLWKLIKTLNFLRSKISEPD